MVYRVLVTGSRELTDEDLVFEALSNVFEGTEDPEFIVINGGARGADGLSTRWVNTMQEDYRVFCEVYKADWETFGKPAGHLRNQEMVDRGADVVLAFYKKGAENKGTGNCVKTARAAGLTVKEFWQE